MDQADSIIEQLRAAVSSLLGTAPPHSQFTAWRLPGWGEARMYTHVTGGLVELRITQPNGDPEPSKLVAVVRSAAEIPGAVDSIRELLDSRA